MYYNPPMCGIFGINEQNQTLAEEACGCISYRGPDQHAVWADKEVSLGFNRLAIIDLDPRASQPMWDEAKEIGIVYNGEIFNFRDIKKELEREYAFRTTSDTEVLIYAYKKYGPRFVERLNGMFALALYDIPKKRLFLYRDHAGIKPLYYYDHNGVFIFGSELKTIMVSLGKKEITPAIDHEGLKTFFGLGYIPSPRTLYQNLSRLPRASLLEYDLGEKKIVRVETYESPKAEAKDENALFSLIERSILDHLIADVPVGLFFSGGTDSSLIASVLHKHKINLETFSIGVVGRDSDRKYFNEIRAHLALNSHVYDFTVKEFNDVYETIMSRVDEPNADISIFPTYFVSQKAASRVKVVLSGEGGDELFFGYNRQRIFAQLRKRHESGKLSFIDRLFLYTPSFKGKNYLFERLFVFFGNPMSSFVLSMSPGRDCTTPAAWAATKRVIAQEAKDPLYYDRDLYLENDLLRKTDFATSLNSLEGRVPLLDSRILAAAPAFEHAYTSDAPSKPVLKRMLATYLPKQLVYRGKSGFGMSLPGIIKEAPLLAKDLEEAIEFLTKRNLLYVHLPRTKAELIKRYPNLCFALISLYRTVKNNEALLGQFAKTNS
jgi:asparagine synthase (glutamine-hydrolysing)